MCLKKGLSNPKTGLLSGQMSVANTVMTEYVQYFLSFLQEMLEDKLPESAQKNINLRILRDLDIPLPPIELQNSFAKMVERVQVLRKNQDELKKWIQNLFDALIQKAFTGKLVA